MKEITPPEGYTVDPTEYEVDLAYEGQEVAEVTRDLTVQEQVKKQAFQLIKISEDGDQTETDLVEGAGFKVYLISSLSKVESGELQPSNGDQFTAEDFRGYDFSKEEVAVTYVDGKAVPVQELITDKKRICSQSGASVWSLCGRGKHRTGELESHRSVFGEG